MDFLSSVQSFLKEDKEPTEFGAPLPQLSEGYRPMVRFAVRSVGETIECTLYLQGLNPGGNSRAATPKPLDPGRTEFGCKTAECFAEFQCRFSFARDMKGCKRVLHLPKYLRDTYLNEDTVQHVSCSLNSLKLKREGV